ncbi:MFS transporter [Paenibacillus sp. A14]|uniref:MFS transporter n=1 Tax=Paenibacillus sp. A14 TaxID=3119820 RepID=UPI002FDFFE94
MRFGRKLTAADKLIRVLAFTMVLSSMSATMFNIVLPEISQQFQLSFAQVSWVTSIYLLIYAIGSVIYGKLSDMFQPKHLLTVGLFIFFVGSMIGLASSAYWMVLLARVLQALGAAVIPAMAMIIPVRYFPAERRGQALGITATGLAIGSAVGPVVSSLMVSVFHWRWLFIIPLLILITLPMYRKLLRDEPAAGGWIDWLGGGLLAGTVALFLLSVTQNGGWFFGAASLILLALFILRIRTAGEPFIPPRLFSNKRYVWGVVLAVVLVGTSYSLPFLTPQLLADLNRLSPGWIGFTMVPGAVATAVLGSTGGKLADTRGTSFLFRFAILLNLLCFALLSSFAGMSPVGIAAFLILGNIGQMFIQISMTKTISLSLPKEQTGVGMGLLSMMNFLAGAAASGIYSRTVDLGSSSVWNPFNPFPASAAYSNIYLVLAGVQAGAMLLFSRHFGGTSRARLVQEASSPSSPSGS